MFTRNSDFNLVLQFNKFQFLFLFNRLIWRNNQYEKIIWRIVVSVYLVYIIQFEKSSMVLFIDSKTKEKALWYDWKLL